MDRVAFSLESPVILHPNQGYDNAQKKTVGAK
jgi:hypothetical protein